MPGARWNPCRKNPRLLSAEQGTRHLRSRHIRYTAARPCSHPPPCGAEALAGARHLRSRAADEEIRGRRDFDWEDLGQLLRRTIVVDRDRITADCVRGFGFL